MILSIREKQVLEALQILGCKYVARNSDNILIGSEAPIRKTKGMNFWEIDWENNEKYYDEPILFIPIKEVICPFIKCEDEHPYLIEELLSESKKKKKTIYKAIFEVIETGSPNYPIDKELVQYVFDEEQLMLLKKIHSNLKVEKIEVEL